MTETMASPQLSDRYAATSGRVQLTGVQALARLPIDQHRRDLAAGLNVGTFISGYEGSPLAGYDQELGRLKQLLDANDVTFVPGLNEEAAATAIQGSQLACTLPGATRDGVLGIWYGKAPGLDRATDALRHGNLMGSHPRGGALVLVGDDPAAKSSTLPCASDGALADLAIPYLYPADSQDVLDLGRHAIELSRATGLWVGLKIVTAVADGSSTVDLAADRPAPRIPPGAGTHAPTARLLHPTLGQLERDLVTNRLRLAREYARLNALNQVVGRNQADVLGVVAAGHTWLDVLGALRRLGIGEADLAGSRVRLLRVGMPWPLEEATVREFADGLEEILVVEEKRSFLETAIRDVLYGGPSQPAVTGKRDADGSELLPAYGELDADVILGPLRRRMTARGIAVGPAPGEPSRVMLPLVSPPSLVSRVPYFCSGCPHNSSTKPLPGTLVGAGIGCHALVLLMDEAQAGTVTGLSQMGGEGMQWIGMAPFLDRDHFVQNIGDGTFDHSGSLAVRAAVAAGANMTYKLLYNSAVAMTGGQRPASGMTVPQIVSVLLAEGVARVIVTTEDLRRYRRVKLPRGVAVWDRSRLAEAQRVLAATQGVTVLVHDQECATEKRRKRKRGRLAQPQARVFINERVCEGCGDCGRKSNCLSVQPVPTEFGRKTRVHQSSCNVDYSCLDGDCPAFMTVVPAAGRKTADAGAGVGAISPEELPAPRLVGPADSFGIRLTGVGGTGVVTVSQILATAGLIAGWHARSLDQTGLAQKGGAVVSDVRFSRSGQAPTNKLGAGECDLYLGCDLLVASDPKNLAVTDAGRTVAVVSVTEVPTGPMVSDPALSFPDRDAISQPIMDRVRDGSVLLDVRAIVLGLFGDDQFANVFLVGAGFQTGALPLPPDAIEEAIRVNGVAVEKNLQAFRRGRQYVADRDEVLRAARLTAPVAPGSGPPETGQSELDRLIRTRSDDLTAYQDHAYARRYLDVVERVRAAERDKTPGSTALTEAVARYLYKLMAYKDEYEVARLSLEPSLGASLAAEFGPGARAAWRLHPPVLRALGMKRKIALGPWFTPAFRVLRAMRKVRGTWMDPFGRTRVRVAERELIEEYLGLVDQLIGRLSPATAALAVRLAELPDGVRGYEDVKMRTVEAYRRAMAGLRAQFDETRTNHP